MLFCCQVQGQGEQPRSFLRMQLEEMTSSCACNTGVRLAGPQPWPSAPRAVRHRPLDRGPALRPNPRAFKPRPQNLKHQTACRPRAPSSHAAAGPPSRTAHHPFGSQACAKPHSHLRPPCCVSPDGTAGSQLGTQSPAGRRPRTPSSDPYACHLQLRTAHRTKGSQLGAACHPSTASSLFS